MDGQRLFLENLSTIDRVVAAVARRHRLPTHERDDFASLVRLRLLEDDARVMRAFENRSSLSTFLTIVISRIFFDFRNAEWGRWRPSAQARRLGPVAVLLDQLMTRDGHRIDEAIEILRVNHKVAMSDTEIHALWESLPRRLHTTVVGEEAAGDVLAPDVQASGAEFAGRPDAGDLVAQALSAALSKLPVQDQLIVQLQFRQGVGATELARHFTISKATFHRRINRILGDLRAALLAQNVDPLDVAVLLRSGSFEFPEILDRLAETLEEHGRLFTRDE